MQRFCSVKGHPGGLDGRGHGAAWYRIIEAVRRRGTLSKTYSVTSPEYTEVQENGRIRYWGFVEEIDKYLRVVALEDGETVHCAMLDRNFTRKRRRSG